MSSPNVLAATETPAFYVMVDWDQTADCAETIEEARSKARRIFETDPLRVNVSIHDSTEELVEDLGISPGNQLMNAALALHKGQP
jgi:hypothetical protein